MNAFVRVLRAAATAAGLPLVGATTLRAYDAARERRPPLAASHPGVRGVIVLAQGGAAFWNRFDGVRRASSWLRAAPDPLEAYARDVTAAIVAAAQRAMPVPVRLVFPTDASVDFRTLAHLAGIGAPSQLGILLHPTYGPWVALRAAVLVPFEVGEPGPVAATPCARCADRPCEAACPVGAVSRRGWDVPACTAYRSQTDETCGSGCHARLGCPVGASFRYPVAALEHHQGAARALMTVRREAR